MSLGRVTFCTLDHKYFLVDIDFEWGLDQVNEAIEKITERKISTIIFNCRKVENVQELKDISGYALPAMVVFRN